MSDQGNKNQPHEKEEAEVNGVTPDERPVSADDGERKSTPHGSEGDDKSSEADQHHKSGNKDIPQNGSEEYDISTENALIKWARPTQTSPAQAPKWLHKFDPVPQDIALMARFVEKPSFWLVPGLAEEDIEQILQWLPKHVDGYSSMSFWFLSGELESNDISALDVVQDMLSYLEQSKNTGGLFSRGNAQSRENIFVVVELNNTNISTTSNDGAAIAKILKSLGMTMVVLLNETGKALGAADDITIWNPDLEVLWWRIFIANRRDFSDEEFDEEWDKAWCSATNRQEIIHLELKKSGRRFDLRDLLLTKADELHDSNSDIAFDNVIRVFKDQNKDEKNLRDRLKRIFNVAPDIIEIGSLKDAMVEHLPLEPQATAIIMLWASLEVSEDNDNIRSLWFDEVFKYQLALMSAREQEHRHRIEIDTSLHKKARSAAVEAVEMPAYDFLIRYDTQVLYKMLGVTRKNIKKRGEVLAFRETNAAEVIGDFLRNEVPQYLSGKIDVFLSGSIPLFDENRSINRMAQRLLIWQLKNFGHLSDTETCHNVAYSLVQLLLDNAASENSYPLRQAVFKLADLLIYWFNDELTSSPEDNKQHEVNFQTLVYAILQRLLEIRPDVHENRDRMFVWFIDKTSFGREELIDIKRLMRLVGNSAPASLQHRVLKFVEDLSHMQDRKKKKKQKRVRKGRLQYPLFLFLVEEFKNRDENDYSPYDRFLAALAMRVLPSSILRLDHIDYVPAENVTHSSDRMLSQIFESETGIKDFVDIMMSPLVLGYMDYLLGMVATTENSEIRYFAIKELPRILISYDMISLKVHLDQSKSDVDDLAEQSENMKQKAMTEALPWLDQNSFIDEVISDNAGQDLRKVLKSFPFKVICELHGLLSISARTSLLDRLDAAFAKQYLPKRDRVLLNTAKSLQRKFLLNVCEIIRKMQSEGFISIKESRYARGYLMDRNDASKMFGRTRT